LRPAWQVVCDLARRMGASGFDFADTAAVRAEMDRQAPETPAEAPPMPDPSPLDDVSALPRHYRGHDLTDVACALGTVLKTTPAPDTAPDTPAAAPGDGRFEILDKAELAPNIHMLTIRAPEIAAACRPGHFVIAMANEKSERIPYTPADWDPETGTVTINVLEAGRSSREVTRLGVGDRVAHLAGPLGTPIEIKRYGTVLCGGGCYGVGGMLPLARALKDAGNDVIVVEEASSAYLLYWEERLRGLCDTFRVATKDGTRGTKGGIQEVVDELVAEGLSIDQAFISGCTFMMMLVCETTQRHKIPTLTAMNPIMLDGTGMCGACRVSVGDETKFACVDGPYLDGHRIDWKALMQRQAAYRLEEIQALPQDAGTHEHAASHTHRCRTI
jgi:NAD(P)H-flavin reductase